MSIDLKKDLNKISTTYFIGIKGVGMTALAQVLKARGIKVSGSDTKEKFFTDKVLKKLKIPVHEGFQKNNIPKDADLVVTSTAYLLNLSKSDFDRLKNPEIKEVLRRKIPILTYPEALGLLFKKSYGIAVCGTHGKSTVTAMLGVILEKAGLDPTVIVGTRVNQWGSNARTQEHKNIKIQEHKNIKIGNLLIVEADEYREAFLNYEPKGLVITSIEYDHPDYFKSFRSYKNAFRKLVKNIPKDGFIVANWDDQNVRDMARSAKYKIIRYNKRQQDKFKLKLLVPGQFNILNALAATNTALELGVRLPVIKKALSQFQGTARRFEIKTLYPKPYTLNPIIIDDYAHHPTEIQVTLKTARQLWPKKRIWAVFQPHTFSRTKALLDEFSRSFKDADKVIVLDVYSSAREKKGEITSFDLAKAIKKYYNNVMYIPTARKAANFLKKNIGKNDIILTMGAGDVWEVGELLLNNYCVNNLNGVK